MIPNSLNLSVNWNALVKTEMFIRMNSSVHRAPKTKALAHVFLMFTALHARGYHLALRMLADVEA